MGGIQGTGRTGGTGRCTDTDLIHEKQNGLTLNSIKTDTQGIGKTVILLSIHGGCRYFCQQFCLKIVPQSPNPGIHIFEMLRCQFTRLAKPDNGSSIFRTTAASFFLVTTFHK